MHKYQPLTDSQWQQLEPFFPKPEKRGRGKPHAAWRLVVNSILCVLCSKGKWASVPQTAEFATKSVAHRWFSIWDKTGLLKEIVDAYKATCSAPVEIGVPPRRKRLSKAEKAALNSGVREEEGLDEELPFNGEVPPYTIPQEDRKGFGL